MFVTLRSRSLWTMLFGMFIVKWPWKNELQYLIYFVENAQLDLCALDDGERMLLRKSGLRYLCSVLCRVERVNDCLSC